MRHKVVRKKKIKLIFILIQLSEIHGAGAGGDGGKKTQVLDKDNRTMYGIHSKSSYSKKVIYVFLSFFY